VVAHRARAVSFASAIAARRGLATCGVCGLLSGAEDTDGAAASCPRCDAVLHLRRPASAERTGALLLAATICYVPANVLPVLVTASIGGSEADTIVGGVVRLYGSGSWILALVVLVASVVIPTGKIAVLGYLLAAARWRRPVRRRDCTQLYRLVALVGRWSLLDVFVGALVAALVQWGSYMSATTGPGLPFFAATAVLTMLAAMAFDPRLVWHEETGRLDHAGYR
jgi:paraquat-inducible protein A